MAKILKEIKYHRYEVYIRVAYVPDHITIGDLAELIRTIKYVAIVRPYTHDEDKGFVVFRLRVTTPLDINDTLAHLNREAKREIPIIRQIKYSPESIKRK